MLTQIINTISDTPNKDSLSSLLEWIDHFCSTQIDFQLASERRCLPPNLFLEFGNKGLMGILGSNEEYGLELNIEDAMSILEVAGYKDLSICTFLVVHNLLGAPLVHKLSDRRLSGNVNSGRAIVSFAITEEGAGSFPKGMDTHLKDLGNGQHLLNGSKIWIGSASWAKYIITFAKNESGQIKALLVESDNPGLKIDYEHKTLGMNGIVQAKVIFDNCIISEDRIIEGNGLAAAKSSFNNGRLGISAFTLGAMKLAIDILSNYMQNRRIAGGLMSENLLVQQWYFKLNYYYRSCKFYLDNIKKSLKANELTEDHYYISKAVITEVYHKVLDKSMQLLGGRCYMENNILARFYRDERVLRIFEGPTEALFAHFGQLAVIDDSFEFNPILDYKPADWISKVKAIKNVDRKKYKVVAYYLGELLAYYKVFTVCSDEAWFDPETLHSILKPKVDELIRQLHSEIKRTETFEYTSIDYVQYDEDSSLDKLLYNAI